MAAADKLLAAGATVDLPVIGQVDLNNLKAFAAFVQGTLPDWYSTTSETPETLETLETVNLLGSLVSNTLYAPATLVTLETVSRPNSHISYTPATLATPATVSHLGSNLSNTPATRSHPHHKYQYSILPSSENTPPMSRNKSIIISTQESPFTMPLVI